MGKRDQDAASATSGALGASAPTPAPTPGPGRPAACIWKCAKKFALIDVYAFAAPTDKRSEKRSRLETNFITIIQARLTRMTSGHA